MLLTHSKQFLRDESGATAIEYSLIAASIALAIMLAVNSLGGTVKDKYDDINTLFKDKVVVAKP